MRNTKTDAKRLAAAFLCGSLFFSGVAMAAPPAVKEGWTSLRVMITGEEKLLSKTLRIDGTMFVPIREVSRLLGEPVYWEESSGIVWIGGADVELTDAAGAKIGRASLTEGEGGVIVDVEAWGLTPGKHGFHLHEKSIENRDFSTAGGHFNPEGKKHGHHNAEGHHMGDLHNLEVQADGTGTGRFLVEGATLEKGAATSVWGRSLVIHAKEDDGMTDPSGNSGDRIAGGNIVE